MTEFYVPRTGEIVLADGSKHVVVKGIRDVPDEIVNDVAANTFGIKPVHEMSASERSDMNLPPAGPDVDESLKVEHKDDAEDEQPEAVSETAPEPSAEPSEPDVAPAVAVTKAYTAKPAVTLSAEPSILAKTSA